MPAPQFARPIQGAAPNQFVSSEADVAALNATFLQLWDAIVSGADEQVIADLVATLTDLRDQSQGAADDAAASAASSEASRTAAEAAALAAASGLSNDDKLSLWTAAGAFVITGATYANNIIASGTLAWPDGSTGALTVTHTSASFMAVNGFNVTHVGFGRRATQPPVTRNTIGQITAQPAITVGAI